MQITIPSAFIDAALQAVSKEETRYYLKGVFIDARGFIAATNGHIAFAARCNDAFKLEGAAPANMAGRADGIIIPADALAQAVKAAGRGKPDAYTIERDAGGLWWILYGNARVHFAPIDGTFPDWTRIVPTAPEALTAAHFDPKYINALGNMAKALRDGKKGEATAFHLHQDGTNPALVTFPRKVEKITDPTGPREDCLAVLMPMRGYDAQAGATFRDTFLAH
jgi:hypothetical protein